MHCSFARFWTSATIRGLTKSVWSNKSAGLSAGAYVGSSVGVGGDDDDDDDAV